MDEREEEGGERANRLKAAMEAKLAAEPAVKGTIACPGCASDGDWYREPGGWSFGCGDCGLRATGFFSRRSAN
jgi:hypothetical protein